MQEADYKQALEKCQKEIERLKEELHREITHDYLTHTYNRRGLKEKCEYLVEVAKRDGSFLSVALFDIDSFDDINREHGRAKGDEVIVLFAQVIMKNTRRVDVVGRFDGEAFSVLMPNTNKEDAMMVSERIRSCIENKRRINTPLVTISGGVATVSVSIGDETDDIYNRLNLSADEALYHAKKAGKNQVLHFENLH